MLAQQLLTFARDFDEEYRQFTIIQFLNETSAILENRPGMDEAGYISHRSVIHQKCQKMIVSTRFDKYPGDWQRVISNTPFGRYLPAYVASEIIKAFPPKSEFASQSSELKVLRGKCSEILVQAQQFVHFANPFIDTAYIPSDKLATILRLPRDTFDNEIKIFCTKLDQFSDLIATISEIVSGQRHAPTMLYTSTSDPSITLLNIIQIAAPLLSIYKDILEIIIHSLEIAKAVGLLRQAGTSIEMQSNITEEKIRNSVGHLCQEYEATDKNRRTELHNELVMRVMDVIPTIKGGARLSLAISNKEHVVTRFIGTDGSVEAISHDFEITQGLEIKLDALANEPALQLPQANRESDT